MPVTEAQALAALPKSGFVRSYVNYATKLTDAPVAYHLATGLSVFASCVDPDLHIWFGGTPLYAPVWCLLVGRSGADRKTTAVAIGASMLREISLDLIADEPGSPEGLRDSLKQNPKQTLFYPEFGEFLQKSSNESSQFAAIRSLMTKLYDCHTVRVRLSARRIEITDPRMSVLSACTMQHLEDYTGPTDYHGGFMSRFATIYARRERTFSNPPPPDPEARERLVKYLTGTRDLVAGRCVGFDAEAEEAIRRWQDGIESHYAANAPEWTRGAVARAPTLARKVALLYAADFGKALESDTFVITMDELRPALLFAQMHLGSIVETTDKLTGSRYGRERKNVLEVIERSQTAPTSLADILRFTMPRIEKRRVMQILDSLKSEGTVHGFFDKDGEWFTTNPDLVPDSHFVAFDGTTLA